MEKRKSKYVRPPQRVLWITVPHDRKQEPMASRSRAGAVADIEFYEGGASIHKYVYSPPKHIRRRLGVR